MENQKISYINKKQMIFIAILAVLNIGIVVWYLNLNDKIFSTIFLVLHIYLLKDLVWWVITDIIYANFLRNYHGVRKNLVGSSIVTVLATPVVFGVVFVAYVFMKQL